MDTSSNMFVHFIKINSTGDSADQLEMMNLQTWIEEENNIFQSRWIETSEFKR